MAEVWPNKKGRFPDEKAAREKYPMKPVEILSRLLPLPFAGITQIRFRGLPTISGSQKDHP